MQFHGHLVHLRLLRRERKMRERRGGKGKRRCREYATAVLRCEEQGCRLRGRPRGVGEGKERGRKLGKEEEEEVEVMNERGRKGQVLVQRPRMCGVTRLSDCDDRGKCREGGNAPFKPVNWFFPTTFFPSSRRRRPSAAYPSTSSSERSRTGKLRYRSRGSSRR